MELWELSARERIRETLARYNHAGDRGRAEELAGQFAEDGVLEVHGQEPRRGRTAIKEYIRSVARDFTENLGRGGEVPVVRHHVSNVLVTDLSSTQVRVSSYFFVILNHGVAQWGRYRDVLVPDGDRWVFAHRLVRLEGELPSPGG
ncbi:MAG: nuclear transport factor 2 family protein [Acidimicrobiia bacterium]|nr:nuclear transport factor 2 family protein [Acidimicrobiia bacterium]